MMKQESIENFLSDLASKAPVPGGGGASALGGAVGSALGSMVGNLTLGKKKYSEYEPDILVILDKLSQNQQELLELMDKDAEAFEPLSRAYSLPKNTEEELAHKEAVLEEALLSASLVPLEIMRKTVEALLLQEELSKKGTRMAISDVAVGVQFLRAALLGASMNVYINTKSMKNRAEADRLNDEADRLIETGRTLADTIFEQICHTLR
ncbi:MAG: cyclodeaminase/cyclohydrolase family protein [Lachnospiraceae bacterium]|nr:cyclodeaminase/cyclohydrolase family protein [Lachnospiraceae bacterium]